MCTFPAKLSRVAAQKTFVVDAGVQDLVIDALLIDTSHVEGALRVTIVF